MAEQHSVFPNQASEFVALTHYCRWREEDGRRETWDEVVDRVVSFLRDHTPGRESVPPRVWERIRDGLPLWHPRDHDDMEEPRPIKPR